MTKREFIVRWHDPRDGPQENRFEYGYKAMMHARNVAAATGCEVKVYGRDKDGERLITEY